MKNILKSLVIVVAVAAVAGVATWSVFYDTETSNGNTFTAGSLDLTVDGSNDNVVKFNVSNMKPGSQPLGKYTLNNVGSINGYLDLQNVAVSNEENNCVDPEQDAGDSTCGDAGDGELQNVVNLRLTLDRNCDTWISDGDTTFYNGLVKNIPNSFDLDETLNAGNSTCISAIFDWWNTSDDNKAQGDSMVVDMTFALDQSAD